jgi:hypothetical protein
MKKLLLYTITCLLASSCASWPVQAGDIFGSALYAYNQLRNQQV